jgi:hypothetical protein
VDSAFNRTVPIPKNSTIVAKEKAMYIETIIINKAAPLQQ